MTHAPAATMAPAAGRRAAFLRLRRRAWRLLTGVSIRTKIMGIVVSLTLLLGAFVTWQVRAQMAVTLGNELRDRGYSVAGDLALRSVDPILLDDSYALYQLLVDTKQNHPDVTYAFVLDPQNQVMVHTFEGDAFPTQLLQLVTSDSYEDNLDEIQHLRFQSEKGVIHDFAAPILHGDAGVVHLGMSEKRLQRVIDVLTTRIILTTGLMALVGILAAIALTWILTRPVLELIKTTEAVGGGDLSVRAPRLAEDEIGSLASAFNRMVEDLETSHQALQEKELARARLLEKLITVQEEERRRIARELHDGIGQALISLMVNMKVATHIDDAEQRMVRNHELRHAVTDILEQVRLLSRELRPSALDDLGLEAALKVFIDEFTQLYPHITADMHSELPERPSSTVEITLYRIIQEAMLNAARHSGGDTISVLVSQRVGRIQAIIEDNGHGFDVEAARRSGRSVGLHAMVERAELVGGSISFESNAEGTSVYVETPLI
ncbi:MAG: hypothetical protein DSY55_02110 [Clostridia bacterium]|nr:MAG: hypothetical protein DSY55_02110 [Clostridia bacterium]